MKKLSLAVGLLALLGTTALAQQTTQSRPTSQAGVRGNTFTSGMTSSNSGAMTSSGMRDSTTGMNAAAGQGYTLTDLGPLSGGTASFASGVNDFGQVVGLSIT